MRLYHGTSERVARLAIDHGILPRSESGAPSNWTEQPSIANHVYLTTTYAGYFAMSATDPEDGRWAIIEVDVDLLPDGDAGLLPDEDFLEQVTRGQELPAEWGVPPAGLGFDLAARTAWFREHVWMFVDQWSASLDHLGTCSHEGAIPAEAITAVSFIDPRRAPLAILCADPMISLMNHAVAAEKYKALTRWFLDEDGAMEPLLPVPPPEVTGTALQHLPAGLREHLRHSRANYLRQQAYMLRVLTERTGVEVLRF